MWVVKFEIQEDELLLDKAVHTERDAWICNTSPIGNVNVRQGPDTGYNSVGGFNEGQKITVIDEVFREDTRYLTSDETIKASLLHKIEDNSEEVSWERKRQEFLNDIKKNAPALYQQAKDLPSRVRIGRKTKENSPSGVLVFGRKANIGVFSFYDLEQRNTIPVTDEEAIKMFESERNEIAVPVTNTFYEQYEQAQQGLDFNFNSDQTDNERLIKKVWASLSQFQNSAYLLKLLSCVSLLSKAKLQLINTTFKHITNVNQIESQLKKFIPLEFLDRLLKLKNQVETQKKEIDIVLSTEFIK